MAKRKKISRRAQPTTAWQALNAPIAYPSEEFARLVFLATAIILLLIWLMPYWGQAPPEGSPAGQARTDADFTRTHADRVAGEISVTEVFRPPHNGDLKVSATLPEWYSTMERASSDVVNAFGVAAEEVLDISEQVQPMAEFYEPGVQAVWDAWLELMADPYPIY